MLKGLVAWVLNTYIGEYLELETLNTDQLSIALLQGQVELEQVPLKKSALRKFDIPAAVKIGVLGKFRLSIPLTRFRSEPWVIQMSNLYVLLKKSDNTVYDVAFDEEYQKSRKHQQLDALETFHKKRLGEIGRSEEPGACTWGAVGASFVAAGLENIHLIIDNVHIRYEDMGTLQIADGSRSFACGLKVAQMTVQTTNQFWKKSFVERSREENLFKVLDLEHLSIYWDSGKPLSQPETFRELIEVLSSDENDHCFVLSPISAKIRMEKNSSQFPLMSNPPIPRFKFDLNPENLNLELSKRQLLEMRLLAREWSRYERGRRYRKWRPAGSITDKPVLWWKFAINCQLEWIRKQRERETWRYASRRAKQINTYCAAYRRRLEHWNTREMTELADHPQEPFPSPSRTSEADSVLIKQIDRDPEYTYEHLHVLRDTVFRRYFKQKKAEREREDGELVDSEESEEEAEAQKLLPSSAGGGLVGWLSSWFYSTPSESPEADEDGDLPGIESADLPEHLKEAEKQLEEGIFDVLNESWDDSLLARIQLQIRLVKLSLVEECCVSGTRVLVVQLSDVSTALRLSPRHHTTALDLAVGDLSAHSELLRPTLNDTSLLWSGAMTTIFAIGKAASLMTVGACSGGGSSWNSIPLLRLSYEQREVKLQTTHSLSLDFSPISIIYQSDAIQSLMQFFQSTVPETD